MLWRCLEPLAQPPAARRRTRGRGLREILRACLFAPTPGAEKQIDGIAAVESRTVSRRVGEGVRRSLCRGTEVTVTLAEDRFGDSSPISSPAC